MKLLLDENLSHRLVPALQAAYPGSPQVSLLGLSAQGDQWAWKHAREFDYVIVTKDDDFLDLAAYHGRPPVVIRPVPGKAATRRCWKLWSRTFRRSRMLWLGEALV